MALPKFDVSEEVTGSGFHLLEIQEGKFAGVKWTYGAINVGETEDKEDGLLTFEYDLIDSKVQEEDTTEFQNLIGSILIYIIEEQVKNNGVVYHGGTDA